jgi:hypothetical protein
MIRDDAAQAWAAATAVAKAIAPAANETARLLEHREEGYAQYMDSLARLQRASRPLRSLSEGGERPRRAEIRAAAEATAAAAREALQALGSYRTVHVALTEASAELGHALDTSVTPPLRQEQWTEAKQTETFTRLAYQYWQVDRPADAANLTTEDFVNIGDTLSARRQDLADAEHGKLNAWLNSDSQADRPTISTPDRLADLVLRELEHDYPPETPDRPTVIDRYLEASSLARTIDNRGSGSYATHTSLDYDTRSLTTAVGIAEAIAARPRTLNQQSSENLSENASGLGGRDPDDDGYPGAWSYLDTRLAAACQDIEAMAAATVTPQANAPATGIGEAQRLRAMSFPQDAATALQGATKTPTARLDHLTVARATRDAARAAAQPEIDPWSAEMPF